MKTMIHAAILALLAGSPAAANATPKAAEPAINVQVPAACADVWKKVYTEFDPSWNVSVLAVTKEDEALPPPEVLEDLVARIPALEKFLGALEAPERDIFFVRVKTRTLAELQKRYPKLATKVIEDAKIEVCRDAARR